MQTESPAETFEIRIDGDPRVYACPSDEKVLIAIERAGQKTVRVGCRQGGCGACRVRVLEGDYATGKMSRAHVTEEEGREGFALSCRLFPKSDLVIAPAFVGPRRPKNND